MLDDDSSYNCSFSQFAKRRGVAPRFSPAHGAEAVELLSLIEAIEETGDLLLCAIRERRMDNEVIAGILEELLKCYSEPLSHSKKLMKIRIETRRLAR